MALKQSGSNLPSVWRFDFGDYQSMGSTFQKFLANLNIFTLSMYNLMNGGIGFNNLQRTIYNTTVTGGKSIVIVNPLPISPSGITLVQISPAPSLAVSFANWSFDGKSISIAPVGLTTGVAYTVSMEIF